MIRNLLAALVLLLAAVSPATAQDGAPENIPPEVQAFIDNLDPQTGSISIPGAQARLELGDKYVFYGEQDAKAILVQLWGNPPESVSQTLGLVMPAGTSPISDSWGAVISFESIGYVSDDDAADVDYDELMELMQEGAREEASGRRQAGYPGIEVVGWAERPNYDKRTHSVVWAQNLKFDDQAVNTLNYDVRTLGRYGVLSLNLVSVMPDLNSVRIAAKDFAGLASFEDGARYADFNASTDRKAEYGIGGLVAAGAGVAMAKKLGIFAIILKFLKPLLIGLVALFFVFKKKILGLFGIGDDEQDEDWVEYASDEDAAAGNEPDGEDEHGWRPGGGYESP
ncbi:hypothetical protein GCM10010923_10240 [Blastomonas marina]|uniref:DUF2167 domain-containing protein n=1 Tax=Blastomonas marina TaxID=1867408 RepID=A0ABQ1F8F8_9SPHN|nr:DUF2167 domain-containing protein [Blastomonas marina]GGA03337.1 hypothetical protein GCM10010923_10240 [Blastomonas marina]